MFLIYSTYMILTSILPITGYISLCGLQRIGKKDR
jgi:hypothetical protein